MCSIGEDDFGDEGAAHSMQPAIASLNINDLSGICSKCKEDPLAVKLSFREAECKKCFLVNVRHKFRAALGSSKVLPKNADVLLIFDGSPSCVTLLDMAYYAQTQNTFKRLHCNLKGLVINDNFLGHQDVNHLENVLNITKRYAISWYYTSLASQGKPLCIIDRSSTELEETFNEEESKTMNILAKIKSLTSRQDLVKNLHKNAIRNAAKQLACPFVFTSEVSSDLATMFLTNISLGRGCSTAMDIGLLDDRIDNLQLVRPIKDLTEEEIHHYVTFNALPTVNCRRYGADKDTMTSIQNLTRSFVDSLQEKFPATVSTVFRTGNKMTTKNHLSNTEEDIISKCRLCCSVLNTGDSKTLLAIEFSRIVSEFAVNMLDDLSALENKALSKVCRNKEDQLCHACRNIINDVDESAIILDLGL